MNPLKFSRQYVGNKRSRYYDIYVVQDDGALFEAGLIPPRKAGLNKRMDDVVIDQKTMPTYEIYVILIKYTKNKCIILYVNVFVLICDIVFCIYDQD